jgi:hypothetical protein
MTAPKPVSARHASNALQEGTTMMKSFNDLSSRRFAIHRALLVATLVAVTGLACSSSAIAGASG